MSKLSEIWKKRTPDWRFAILAYVIARISLSAWSMIVYSIFPVSLQNLDLFGEPILTVFDLRTSERNVYSRQVNGTILTFHAIDSRHAVDEQTGSLWSVHSGQALQGAYAGSSLAASSHTGEDLFPYLGAPPTKSILLSFWQRFDANWYLKIATRGYDGSDGSTVYFPLYPVVIRVLSFILDPLLAAMLISNLALIGVLVLLYRIISDLMDETIARRALIYFLIFPTAFYLTTAYTESVFLLFILGSFYFASHRKWSWSVLWGMLAALTRLQGVLLVLPLTYMLWRELDFVPIGKLLPRALPLSFIPLATLSFLGFSSLSLINTYQGKLHAKFILPWENIWVSISLLMGGKGTIVDTLNLVVTLGLIAMMFPVWKKLPLEYSLYSLLMLLAPMFRMTTIQPLVSMSRYALAIFPVFIVLGIWGRNPWVNRAILYISVLLQLYLSAQFILWGWVA